MKIITSIPEMRQMSAERKCPIIPDKQRDIQSTAAQMRFMTAADSRGIFMPLLQYAADAM
jgi:hypothetical protein